MSAPWRVNAFMMRWMIWLSNSLQLFRRRCTHAVERRHAVLDAINPIEHQAMQMNVEIGHRTEALDERDPPVCVSRRLNPALFDQ